MFRGGRTPTRLSADTAVPPARPLRTPAAPFAAAHTFRHAEAKALPGSEPSGRPPRIEDTGCRRVTHPGDPTGPRRIRDRRRVIAPAPFAPERPLPARGPGAETDTGACDAARADTSRRATAHAPAALEPFRG